MQNKMIVFENKKIRHAWHEGDWWFSVVDVVGVLTGSVDAKDYWYRLKIRESEHDVQLSTFCRQLKLESQDGKKYLTDCATKQGLFRIIQSIPSRKAEPFKLWLAKVGSERVDEIENPELAQDRMKAFYEEKGYPKSWIEKRIRGIAVRQDLTDEWKNRGVEENKDYAVLTNEIAKATFNKTIKEYRAIKGMQNKKENLRDYMTVPSLISIEIWLGQTHWELILTMIGEKATSDITIAKDDKDFGECKVSDSEGGEIAGNTRKEIEQKTGREIVTNSNFIGERNKKLEKANEKYL